MMHTENHGATRIHTDYTDAHGFLGCTRINTDAHGFLGSTRIHTDAHESTWSSGDIVGWAARPTAAQPSLGGAACQAARSARVLSLLFLLALLTTSCDALRDDLPMCEPLTIHLAVKDKNYVNVDETDLEDRVSESLPFRAYVKNIHLTVRDYEDGSIVYETPLQDVTVDDEILTIALPDEIQYGKYYITVWGNMDDASPLGSDTRSLDLHPNLLPGDDAYLVTDTMTYSYTSNGRTLSMLRTKGKLIIEGVNPPVPLYGSDHSVSHIYGTVSHRHSYSDETSVEEHFDWDAAEYLLTKSVISPSTSSRNTNVKVTLYDENGENPKKLYLPNISTTISRNTITVIQFKWTTRGVDIYVLLNDSWRKVSSLTIVE